MASHPSRPYESTGTPSWGGTAGGRSGHPTRPYGTTGNPTSKDSIGHGRQGQKTPLGPMPTRSPTMDDDPDAAA